MSVLARRLLAGCLLVTLVASPALAGWWDDLDRGESVSLSDLIAQHSRYRDRVVSFFCVFHRRDEVFAPLASPFSPQRHVNFAVWRDGTPMWEQEGFTRDYPFLYMGKTHPQMAELLSLELYTRIEVTGRVKGLIRARPCIDVISFRQTGHRLGRSVVQSIMGGDRYAEQGQDELAYDNYLRALRPDLPPSYKLLVEKRVAEGLRRLGRLAEAASVEGGGILGASGPPERIGHPPGSLLGDPLPGDPGATSDPRELPPLISDDLPGQPVGPSLPGTPEPRELPPLVSDDLPGQPVGPRPVTQDLPGQPVGPRPVTEDLPGTPASEVPAPPPLFPAPTAPSPRGADLPGTPAGVPSPEALPPAPVPAPVPAPAPPGAEEPSTPPTAEEAVVPKPPRVPPSRHRPRLSGVK